jgi:hypothetical protein
MKKWFIIIGVLSALFVGGYFAVFKTIVPKAASAFMPVKWQNIPIGQKRNAVHEYLGAPSIRDSNKDQWQQKINDLKRYVLEVTYNKDSVAINYDVAYEVEMFGIIQRSEISSDTLR